MQMTRFVVQAAVFAGLTGAFAACATDSTAPVSTSDAATMAPVTVGALATSIRLRCDRRSGPTRSKISVDGRGLRPATGMFRGRVHAGNLTFTTPAKRAVNGEAEFDFASNRNDILAGATRIPATFAAARSGPDVVSTILNAQGKVVATQSGECTIR